MQSQKEIYDKHHNTAEGRIRVWFGIRQIMNSTDRLLLKTKDAARELKTGIHMVFMYLKSSLFVISSMSKQILYEPLVESPISNFEIEN